MQARGGTRAERLERRRQQSRRRTLWATGGASTALVIVLVALSGAVAYWTAGGTGTGNGAATGLAAPTNVSASATSAAAHVSWTGVAAPGGVTFGYYVQRFSSADGYTTPSAPSGTCTSSALVLLPALPTSCDDASLAPGTYKYRVVVVFRSWTAPSTLSAPITVFVLDHFVISTASSTTAGTPQTVTVTAKDSSNVTINNYIGTIHFTSTDTAATLPSNYTFVTGDAGSHVFTNGLVLKTKGTQTIAVADTSLATATGSTNVVVAAAALDHFVVSAPASATSAIPFATATVAAKDAYGNPAAGWTSVTQCVTFSGPANAPDGTTPTYPAGLTCLAGQSLLTFDSSGVSTGFNITLIAAETTALTVTASAQTGTSSNITVSAGTAAGITFANASNRNGAVSVTCTGPIATLTCTPSTVNAPGNGRFFTANVMLVDAHQNPAINTTAGAIVITLTRGSGSALAPTSLSIPTGQTTSTATFTLTLSNGSSSATVTATATVASTAVSVQLTTT
jgi:hypothetical protein